LVKSLLTWAGFDPAVLAERRETFRQEHEDEIRRVVSELRARKILGGVDRGRYRAEVSPDLVLEKVAEAVALTLRNLHYARTLKEKRAKADQVRRTLRDGYRHMARQLRHGDPREAARLAKRAAFYAELAQDWKGEDPRPRLPGYPDISPSMHLNHLVLDLVAILTHLTNMSPNYLLGGTRSPRPIIPATLRLLWDCGRDCVPPRGAANPLKRYRDSAARIEAAAYNHGDDDYRIADDNLGRRAVMFARDDRFPLSLFEPHRTIRTVPYRHT